MIVEVDLDPTQGSETGKRRPAIVVTNDIYNQKVPVIQVVPITEWSEQKARIVTNVTIEPCSANGWSKRSPADCLQTRPIDRRHRLRSIWGNLDSSTLTQVDQALRKVFALSDQPVQDLRRGSTKDSR
jgi:mRNA interferase MazF